MTNFSIPIAVMTVDIAPNGEFFVAGYNTGKIRVWSINNGNLIYSFKPNHYQIRSLNVSPNSKYILSGGNHWSVRLWSVEDGTEIRSWTDEQEMICNVAYTSDNAIAFVGGILGNAYLLNVETGEIIKWFTHDYPADASHTVAISQNGRRALTGFKDGFSYLWNVETGEIIARLYNKLEGERFGHAIMRVGFSADSKYAITSDSKIFIWDAEAGHLMKTFVENEHTLWEGVFLNDNQHLLAASLVDGKYVIRLIELSSGAYLRTFEGHEDIINSIAVSRDDKYAVTGSNDGTARLWDIHTGRELYRIEP